MTNKRDWINAVSNDAARSARSKEEWRLAINQGDYIDAINFYDLPFNQQSK